MKTEPTKASEIEELTIQRLKFFERTYSGVTQEIASAKNRFGAIGITKTEYPDFAIIENLESIKGKINRELKKLCVNWPIYNTWLSKVQGVGEATSAKLILLYYYKFQPICKDCGGDIDKDDGFKCSVCGKEAKKDGILKHRIMHRDFKNISSLWKYMGMHNAPHCPNCRIGPKKISLSRLDASGTCPICKNVIPEKQYVYKKPKRQKSLSNDWTTTGRTLCFLISDQFVRNKKSLYRGIYDKKKANIEKNKPDIKKGHRHNMACNETAKRFLSDFWMVARTVDGLEVTKPYICQKNPAHNYRQPLYFDGKIEF